MAPPADSISVDALPGLLEHDTRVKLAGIDVDGILRGKIVSKKKFLSIAQAGFGFCSVIFGWDMHDQTYMHELKVSNAANGFRDMLAIPDLATFRRIPWEANVPFFLVSFFDPVSREPIAACPRGLLKTQTDRLQAAGFRAMAGGMFLSPSPPCHLLMPSPPGSRVRVLHLPHPGLFLLLLLLSCRLPPAEPAPSAPLADRGHVWLLSHPPRA